MPSLTLRESKDFRLYQRGDVFSLRCKDRSLSPGGCRVTSSDVDYLMRLSMGNGTFDAACVMDYGLAAFDKPPRA